MGIINKIGVFPIVEKLKKENLAFIPDSFYESLERFCKRNEILTEINKQNKHKVVKQVCLQCLRAFILDKAITRNHISIDLILLADEIDAEVGHLNYYADQGILKRVKFVS